jgi:hypothetical protein
MIKLGFAIYDIGLSSYRFYHATTPQQKKQNTEAVILGLVKAAFASCICLSLSTACYVVENRQLKYALIGVTFCLHPPATIDVVCSSLCIDGIFYILTAYIYHGKIAAELNKIAFKAIHQARAEGYRFYNFWEKIVMRPQEYPPETRQRISDIIDTLFKTYDHSQIKAWGIPMTQNIEQGIKLMKWTALATVGALFINQIPTLCWMDRKLVVFSKRVAALLQ